MAKPLYKKIAVKIISGHINAACTHAIKKWFLTRKDSALQGQTPVSGDMSDRCNSGVGQKRSGASGRHWADTRGVAKQPLVSRTTLQNKELSG